VRDVPQHGFASPDQVTGSLELRPGQAPRQARDKLILPGSPKRTHPEPHSVPIEQFLAMLRFDQRDELAELPIDLNMSGRDDFI